MKIYLAGPICGYTYDDANGWREEVAHALEPRGFTCLSPLRGKAHLAGSGILTNDFDGGAVAVRRDFFDIDQSDVVLAYLPHQPKASLGTVAELGYAYCLRKYIVAVLEPGVAHVAPSRHVKWEPESLRELTSHGTYEPNPHEHVFIDHMADRVVSSLSDAITVLEDLNPCPVSV